MQKVFNFKFFRKKGFTIIELLVAMILIGILATLAIVALNSSRMRARDIKRISNIKEMQHALEMYLTAENKYPDSWVPGQPLITPSDGQTIMNKMPSNDKNASEGACSGMANNEYSYSVSGDSYILTYCLAGEAAGIRPGVCFASPNSLCSDTIDYGGHAYKTVVIDNKLIMSENMQVGGSVEGSQMVNNSTIEKKCYNGGGMAGVLSPEENCNKYGGLYSWDEAMQYSIIEKAQGICPRGWHIPSNEEWSSLISKYSSAAIRDTSFPCDETGCVPSTNESGFSALPAGYSVNYIYDHMFNGINNFAYYWSSTPGSQSNKNCLLINNNSYQIFRVGLECGASQAVSVRCFKD